MTRVSGPAFARSPRATSQTTALLRSAFDPLRTFDVSGSPATGVLDRKTDGES